MSRKVSPAEVIGRAAAGLFAALILNMPFTLFAGKPAYDSAAASLIHIFIYFVKGQSLANIAIFAAVYAALGVIIEKRRNLFDPWAFALSGVLAFVYLAAAGMRALGDMSFFMANGIQTARALICAAGYWLIFYICARFVSVMVVERGELRTDRRDDFINRHVQLLSFAAIFIGWLPWLIICFPGSFCYDSIYQLQQFFGATPVTTHHPPLSTLILGLMVWTGKALGSMNLGVFLYVLLQTVFGAFVFSLIIKKLYDMGIRGGWCCAALAFYALSPLWGGFAQWVEKDLMYAEAAGLFTVALVDVFRERRFSRSDFAFVTASALLMSLLRNNGIYAAVPTLFLMVFWLKGWERKKAAGSFAILVLAFLVVTHGLYPALDFKSGSKVEALSVPLQQTARYVTELPFEVTPEEKEAIDGVLQYRHIPAYYNPELSDPVKGLWREPDNDELKAYLRVWAQMFKKHPQVYFEALLNNTYSYAAPVCANVSPLLQYDLRMDPANVFVTDMGVHKVWKGDWEKYLGDLQQASSRLPVICFMQMPGAYTWLLLICLFVMWKARRPGRAILLVPALMNVLVCLASPLNNSMRYVLPEAAVMPLMLGYTYWVWKTAQDEKAAAAEAPATPEAQTDTADSSEAAKAVAVLE
ncbi:MAG: DUF6020 family protein [Anaerovoracaceae bacterium]|nr:DUF6020 family protein [Bacillota bacterium]MDY2671099.1 DUF6020 family protein [Anaerovoracaceae bacterium]